MNIPPSEHFTPIPLTSVFNRDRATLTDTLQAIEDHDMTYGEVSLLGIPFEMGSPGQANVIVLDDASVRIAVNGIQATYILFAHTVEDRVTNYLDGFADSAIDGNELGHLTSEYSLTYSDGSTETTPVLRRFAIQQSHIAWGASPFAAAPAKKSDVFPTVTEEIMAGLIPSKSYGRGETRHSSARDGMREKLWIYALPNPHPDKSIQQIILTPKLERSLIYGITTTQVKDHPLRPGTRQKLILYLPDWANLNDLDELEGLDIDLGQVISARAVLNYDQERWLSTEANVQPEQADGAVVIEYIAHPMAKLYLGTAEGSQAVYDLSKQDNGLVTIPPANRPVRICVVDKESGQPTAVRLHIHGEAGEYLPPKGYHRQVNGYWFEDNYGEFVNSRNQYCYILGECVADLPLGEVYVEITRGYEVAPVRTRVTITPDTDELVFELEHVLHWRTQGWVTADTHVHFLSPQTALLEGAAEGVNVVNLLASQWGEMFSNVSDFDGRTTLGSKDFGGDGEFLVRVGTENRMQVLGHISLLGYSGAMIHPLCSGGPSESALGDPQEVTMADWAQRCIEQGGLVVMPHGPNPQCERAADIVLGLIHAIEMMTFNPFDAQINPYGIADWYRYLNLGYHVPVVGGSDKMAASSLLGGVRTYTNMGDDEFTYENWMRATQAGNTFVTVGPLAEIIVEGQLPGSTLKLPTGGGEINVTWRVESVRMPIEQVEVVVGGLVVDQVDGAQQLAVSGSATLMIDTSTWVALRVRGSYRQQAGDIAAHTSAVQVVVDGQPLFNKQDAITVLSQIEGAMAYVDTLAPRPDVIRYKQLRVTLESAHNQLHQRMHQQGIYHEHTRLHSHKKPHEH